MAIKGFQGTSLLDFPRRVASLIFYGGCNLRCPYCHNPALVEDPQQYPDIPEADVLALLKQRQGFIDGVVISGGEPTLVPGLGEFIAQIKQLDLLVKLDTNGLQPRVVEELLAQNLLDFVAMDIKTAVPRYAELSTHYVDVDALQSCVALLKQAPIEVEFRTTCVPGLVEEADIHAMGALLSDEPLWVLQQFVPEPAMDEKMRRCLPHTPQVVKNFATIAANYVKEVQIRGL
jgi:pyruvate formate lyase activating enzyme